MKQFIQLKMKKQSPYRSKAAQATGSPYHVHIWKFDKSQSFENKHIIFQTILEISKRSKENTQAISYEISVKASFVNIC